MSARLVLSLLVVLASCMCNAQGVELEWLEGNWVSIEGEMQISELWKIENDGLLVGKSETTVNDSIVFSEILRIEKVDSEIVYIAVLPTKTALFKQTLHQGNLVEFSDETNDFPSSLRYELQNQRLLITLEGSGRSEKLILSKQ